MTHDRRFRRHEHLRRKADYARAFAEGRRAGNGILLIYVVENGLAWSRLGLSVGKRVGNAVRRNYVRRRIREAFRASKATLPRGLDIVCVAKPQAGLPGADFKRAVPRLVEKAVSHIQQPRRNRSELPSRPMAPKSPRILPTPGRDDSASCQPKNSRAQSLGGFSAPRLLSFRVAWPSGAPPCRCENMPVPAYGRLGHGPLNPQAQS